MHDIRPFLPEPFTQPGTLLYIGARPDAHSWLDELHQAGNSITVLEIWPENAEGLKGDRRIKQVITGDVREIDSLVSGSFDYIFWWHGPEHLAIEEIDPTLAKLETRAKLVAMACPWGEYRQGAHKGNPHEEHKSTLYPPFFVSLGYQVRSDGLADMAGSEIVAWRWGG